MNSDYRVSKTSLALLKLLAVSVLLAGCSNFASLNEAAIVIPDRLTVRNSMDRDSSIVAELRSGDRVIVSQRSKTGDGNSWSMLSGPRGESGWVESRFLIKEDIVEKSRIISAEVRDIQTQAIGRSKKDLRLRFSADRSNEQNVITILPAGTLLEIVIRERKPKPATLLAESLEETAEPRTAQSIEYKYDTWYKVRLKGNTVLPAGWIYGGLVGLEIPDDIVYYVSSGRRITGWHKIGTVTGEDGKTGDHYLVLERVTVKPDEEVDFDRIKVLAYDPSTRDYTTPFREDISGRFPVALKMERNKGQFQLNAIDRDKQLQLLTFGVEMLDDGRVKVIKPSQK
jgi:uncharacterized protein YgiM (DUF1202 family)